MSSEILPPNWSWVKLGDVCEIDSGIGFPTKFQGIKNGKFPFYKVGDISQTFLLGQRFLTIANNYIDEIILKELKAKLIPRHSIVFAKIGEALKLNRRAITTTECLVDNNVMVIKCSHHKTEYLFLFYFLLTIKLGELSRSTTVPSIRKSDVEEILFPLPPLPEQKKIVEKIEELFSGLDSGVASLKKAKEQIRLYRQSVLASAFSGKLLTQSAERQAHSELPTGWKWVKLGEIVEDIEMAQKKNKKTEDEFIYYDIGGINNKTNTIESFKKYKWKKAPSRARQIVKKGDVLFSTVRTYLKNIALLNFDFDSQIASTGFCIIRPDSIQLISGYIFYYSLSRQFLEPLNALQTGSSYPAVRDNDVFNQLIPLAPFNLQTQIVEEIEKRFSEADNLEKAIDESLAKSETLRQSILKKAFEGRLV
jgi:type I restriction enzyme S subunit